MGHVQHYLWNVLKVITSRAFIVYLFVFLLVMLSLWRGSTHYSNYSESGGQARRGPAGEDRGQAPCWDGGEWNDWLYCHQHLTIIITAQPHTYTLHTSPLTNGRKEGKDIFKLFFGLTVLNKSNTSTGKLRILLGISAGCICFHAPVDIIAFSSYSCPPLKDYSFYQTNGKSYVCQHKV